MEQNSNKGMSIAALVCGIVGCVGMFMSAHPVIAVITLVVAILGIVFGAKGMKASKVTGEGKGLAVAGLVLGIIGTVFAAIGVICWACVACAAKKVTDAVNAGDLNDLLNQLNP